VHLTLTPGDTLIDFHVSITIVSFLPLLNRSFAMAVKLVSSQSGNPDESPISYTGNPLLLCWADILLLFKNAWSIVGIIHPMNQWLCGDLDELYPSVPNLICVALHGFLIALQFGFLASLPILVMVPVGTAGIYVAGVMVVNAAVCWLLNGSEPFLEDTADLGNDHARFKNECWVYLNGVSIGYVFYP
jgi:hypothetical protein